MSGLTTAYRACFPYTNVNMINRHATVEAAPLMTVAAVVAVGSCRRAGPHRTVVLVPLVLLPVVTLVEVLLEAAAVSEKSIKVSSLLSLQTLNIYVIKS